MPKFPAVIPPIIPPPPKTVSPDVYHWFDHVKRELDTFFATLISQMPDKHLNGYVSKQTVAAGFTIEPDGFFIELNAAGAVVSSVTTAIKDGRTGQWIVLQNMSNVSITIKNAANTALNADRILTEFGTLLLRWDDANWVRVSVAEDN